MRDTGPAAVATAAFAGVGFIEPGAFITAVVVMFVALGCAAVTYWFAIRETRKEINSAFDAHLRELHEEHEEIIGRTAKD